MSIVSMKQLLESGAHFGHITQKWNPMMKQYIHSSKSGIYVINLHQTLQKLKEAYHYLSKVSSKGGKVLFVGTKFRARDIIEREAKRSHSFYSNYRWLGGQLTNFNTIRQSIIKLKKIEDIAGEDNTYPGLIKKEASKIEKERKKMELVLGGIKDMRKMPSALFVIDIKKESIAVEEANKLGIPVVAVVDTNCNPSGVDYVIPGNDDSVYSIELFTSVIASAILEGRQIYENRPRETKNTEKKSSKKLPKTKEQKIKEDSKKTVLKTKENNHSTKKNQIDKDSKIADKQMEITISNKQANTHQESSKPSTQITASLVKELREITGAAMMDCKKALVENNGDLEASKESLRKKGQALADKKSSRETKEGAIDIHLSENSKQVALVKVACETDFVARNDKFLTFIKELSQFAMELGVDTFIEKSTEKGSIQELISSAVLELGENIVFLEGEKWETNQNGWIGSYTHSNRKIATLVELNVENQTNQNKLNILAKEICMHIAATQVKAIDEKDLDPEILTKEKEFLLDQAKDSGKPKEIIEKMVQGRIQKFKKEICLLNQPFVKNPDQTIQQLLETYSKEIGSPIKIKRFYKSEF